LTLAFSVFLGVFFSYNYLITGNALVTPFERYEPSERPGFHHVESSESHHQSIPQRFHYSSCDAF